MWTLCFIQFFSSSWFEYFEIILPILIDEFLPMITHHKMLSTSYFVWSLKSRVGLCFPPGTITTRITNTPTKTLQLRTLAKTLCVWAHFETSFTLFLWLVFCIGSICAFDKVIITSIICNFHQSGDLPAHHKRIHYAKVSWLEVWFDIVSSHLFEDFWLLKQYCVYYPFSLSGA